MPILHRTYLSLIPLSALHDQTKGLADCAAEYQVGCETDRAVIFSHVFCESYVMIRSVARNYFGLTEQDKVSFAMEELHNALIHYTPEKGAKFTTLLKLYLSRRFFAETYKLNYDKRKVYRYTVYLEDALLKEDDKLEIIDLLVSLSQSNLTVIELEYCKRILETQKTITDSDMSFILGVTPAAVNKIRKRIEKKIVLLES